MYALLSNNFYQNNTYEGFDTWYKKRRGHLNFSLNLSRGVEEELFSNNTHRHGKNSENMRMATSFCRVGQFSAQAFCVTKGAITYSNC